MSNLFGIYASLISWNKQIIRMNKLLRSLGNNKIIFSFIFCLFLTNATMLLSIRYRLYQVTTGSPVFAVGTAGSVTISSKIFSLLYRPVRSDQQWNTCYQCAEQYQVTIESLIMPITDFLDLLSIVILKHFKGKE